MSDQARKILIAFLGAILTAATLSLIGCLNQEKVTPRSTKIIPSSSPTIRVAVTDSGLGGLSVVAHLVQRLNKEKPYREVEVIFFNALFSSQGGYNSLPQREDKIQIFSSALESLALKYQPDLILIGCNTLSVLFPDTTFAHRSQIPVVGIVESGMKLLGETLRQHPEAWVIIFGTPTTISEGTYQEELIRQGFLPERIIAQACPELELYIERGFDREETEWLIQGYVEEALQKLPDKEAPLVASLNCTHYSYALPFWKKALAESGHNLLSLLNPNEKMIEFLFPLRFKDRFPSCQVKVKVVSMIPLSQEVIHSISRALSPISRETAKALENYELVPNLFEWQKYLIDSGTE
ncbi:aspartate/glutamate racemase family protein [Candidatus Aminicenantes bacterium AC-334-K16]|nr:aspartate/glutamate racemase family protein [Candidatus Aminicenantes bacterium AC-334-K16]